MTMKLTKMAGAFALTAALAMTAVPAFAAADATNTDNFKDGGNNTATATTKVYAEAINASLNATIPTRVAIVVPATGSGEIKAPSSDVYKIINNTTTNQVFLRSVEATPGSFSLSTTTSGSLSNSTLAMKLQAGTASFNLTTGTQSPSSAVSIAANGGELPLALSGTAQIVGQLSASTLESAVMNINYTIGTTAN